jgi:hypothetical protein
MTLTDCDVGHAHVLGLADKAVQKHSDGERIGERVLLLCTFFAGRAHGVPDVPLVEADSWPRYGFRDLVPDACEIRNHVEGGTLS